MISQSIKIVDGVEGVDELYRLMGVDSQTL